MSRRIALVLAAAALAGAMASDALLVSPAAATSDAASPHIVARPSSVMVNTTTKLTGKHFVASKRITIEECAQSTWVVMANPCDSTNTIHVKTDSQGRFHAVFNVQTCFANPSPGFSQTCYIGEPLPSGVDTITLAGAVAITVTGP